MWGQRPEVVESSGLAAAEPLGTAGHPVGSPQRFGPDRRAPAPWNPLKAGAGDTENRRLLMNCGLLGWHTLKDLFGPGYKSVLDMAFWKAFSCFNAVSREKTQDRKAAASASSLHSSFLRKGYDLLWPKLRISILWESCCLTGRFCPTLEDKLGAARRRGEGLGPSQTCFHQKHTW